MILFNKGRLFIMKKTICLLLIALFLVGCSETKTETKSELDQILEKNNYIIVDVRTPEEYGESHVKGSLNIPYDEIDENVELDKTKTIIVYCKSGKRAGIAYDTLKDLGYDVFNLGAFASIKLEKE